jgi:carotenoid cleavage dioxygenase-like enzyme
MTLHPPRGAAAFAARSIETMAPFRRSQEQHVALPAQLAGHIPDWLRGEVVRTCPAVFETPGWRAAHWFDGLCMLYAFRITDDGVDFRSRLLDSEAARDAWQGKALLGSYGTPTARPWWRRILEPVPRMTDNDNVNLVRIGDDLVAMTEGSRQLRIDDATLAVAGPARYADDMLGSAVMLAHPHFDFTRNKVVNVATGFGMQGTISVFEHAPGQRQRTVVGAWRTKRVPYVHTFGLTPQHAILVAHPFTVTAASMLWSSKGYIDHFVWRPEEGTRLVLIDRATGAVREHLTEPFFMYHTVNAFERGDEAVLDLLAYPDAGIVAALRVERMAARLPELRPKLVRLVMRPGVERVAVEQLGDAGFEFPAVNYMRVSGRPYRYAYGAANGWDGAAYTSAVVKTDLSTGTPAMFIDADYIVGEPLFVARPGGVEEDDGVLLAVGSRREGEASILAIIDARTMALVASATVPSAIALGFHGSFVAFTPPAESRPTQ